MLMKSVAVVSIFAVSVFAHASAANETEARALVDWSKVDVPEGAKVGQDGGQSTVTVAGQVGLLASATEPRIKTPFYAIVGQVKYEGVDKEASVEMWSVFGEQERYFTRTLAPEGPTGKIVGSSDWRTLMLPFQIGEGETKRPQSLEFRVDLPGKGTVTLSELKVLEFESLAELQQQYLLLAKK